MSAPHSAMPLVLALYCLAGAAHAASQQSSPEASGEQSPSTSENNTLAIRIPANPAGGCLRHLTIDWNDSFGFLWTEGLEPIQAPPGMVVYLDFDLVLRDTRHPRAALGSGSLRTPPARCWATSRMRTSTRNDGSPDTRTRHSAG